MHYLYAILHDNSHTSIRAGLAGVDGQSPTLVCSSGLAAVVSVLASAPAPDEAAIWRHEALVEAYMSEGTVLPVRFGTMLADAAAVSATLDRHQAALRGDLERLAGCVELGLRGLAPAEAPSAPLNASYPTGRAYIETRLAEQRAHIALQTVAAAIHSQLAPLARVAQRGSADARQPLRASYLVEDTQIEPFRQAVAAIGQTQSGLRLICTGPWPPYSFVSALEAPRGS